VTANPLLPRRAAVWLLLGLTIAAYANSFAGAFLFDDYAVVLDDPRLRSIEAFRAGAATAIRLVTKATFLVDRWVYGERPAGYHALNLVLHLVSGLLLYRILAHPSLQRSDGAAAGADRQRIAFGTTLLFLLHPIATETVTYVSGRPTGLMTACYLAAFLLFLEARVAELGSARQAIAVASAAGCLALSLLAKEVAVVFPALLVLYEAVWLSSERRPLRRALVRIHVPLSAVVLLFLAFAAFHQRYAFLFHYSLALRGWYVNVLTQANAVAYGITLFVRPGQLNFDHDLRVYTSILQGPTLLSIAALVGLVTAAVALARRAPLFSFGVLWFFLHVLPTNSVLARYDLLSERNLYLPSIGLYLAAVSAGVGSMRWLGARLRTAGVPSLRIIRQGRVVAWLTGAVLVVGLVGATVGRNALYADPVAFWSDAVGKSPRKARAHTNLGHACFVAGDLDRAIREFRLALALDPLDPVAQRNLLEAWMFKTQPGRQRPR
jgi:protein O-mannosyl-transferase